MTDTHRELSRPTAADRPAVPQNPAEIELEIQRTRARMTEHVDALTWKLSPDNLRARARHKLHETLHETQEAVVEKVRHTAHEVGDTARQAGSGLFDTLKANPIPAAMIGAGLAWLVVGSRRRSHDELDSGDTYGGYYNPRAYVPADTAVTGMASQSYGGTAGGGIHASESMSAAGRSGYAETGASTAGSMSTAGAGPAHGNTMGVGTMSGRMETESESRSGMGAKAGEVKERIGETASHAREAVRDRAHAVTDRASHAMSAARSRATDLRYGAADRARRTRGWAEQQMDENPLVLGAAVLALGAVVGSLVPTTRREDELIGPRRDELMDRARGRMREAREVLGATARETLESVKEEAGMQKETLRSTAEDLSSELKTSAKKVAHDAKETARTEAEQRNLM